MRDDWSGYDAIASDYASLSEESYFAAPAGDLVRRLIVGGERRIVDIGTGSGAVAAAMSRIRPETTTIGCDASMAMLRLARVRVPLAAFVLAGLPRLPFQDGTFDAAAASFVLSHLQDPARSLVEIRRVLVPAGAIGITAWSSSAGESGPGQLWESIARDFMPPSADTAVASALPAENTVSSLDGLRGLVIDAGFVGVEAEQRRYDIELATQAFLASRVISMTARYMVAHLHPARWHEFVSRAEQTLLTEYGPRIRFETAVNFVFARAG